MGGWGAKFNNPLLILKTKISILLILRELNKQSSH